MHTFISQRLGVMLSLGIAVLTLALLHQSGVVIKLSDQSAQVISSTPVGVTAGIHVSNTVDCELDPLTNVVFDINPPEGATITVPDGGATRTFSSNSEEGFDGYFANNTYKAGITAKPGFTLLSPQTQTFIVASTCGSTTQPSVSSLPESTSTKPAILPAPLPPPAVISPSPAKTTAPEKTTSTDETETVAKDTVTTKATSTETETCDNEASCAKACATGKVCQNFITEVVLASSTVDTPPTEEAMREYFSDRNGARVFVDSDKDGISDFDEVNIYHTNPNNPDTDHDGVPDGAEILAHQNPRANTATGTVVFEDPHLSRAATSTTLSVTSILAVSTSTDSEGKVHLSQMTISGAAPANSFVTIYIFSEPIVVTIKADETGSWTYTLDKEIPDGSHEIYSAIADANGRVLAKSSPLPFVKEAQALVVGGAVLPVNEKPGFFTTNTLLLMSLLFAIMIILAVILIGSITGRKNSEVTENLPKE